MTDRTTTTSNDAATFLSTVQPPGRRAEAATFDALFRRATGWEPVLWPGSILGYGRYHYRYESGREGEAMATGFSRRVTQDPIYIMGGFEQHAALLARLGPHNVGKACLSLTRLSDIDLGVLEALVQAGLKDLQKRWPLTP